MLNDPCIASTKIHFIRVDGKREAVIIEVGLPVQIGDASWRCEVDLKGISGETTAMRGRDAFDALCSSLLYLRLRLQVYRDSGVKVVCWNTEDNFQFDYYFPSGRAGKEGVGDS